MGLSKLLLLGLSPNIFYSCVFVSSYFNSDIVTLLNFLWYSGRLALFNKKFAKILYLFCFILFSNPSNSYKIWYWRIIWSSSYFLPVLLKYRSHALFVLSFKYNLLRQAIILSTLASLLISFTSNSKTDLRAFSSKLEKWLALVSFCQYW